MKIQEVCDLLNITKKAIYYYEKQGLLSVKKDQNGYRIFEKEDIERLHEISLYRKMDIEIYQIKELIHLDENDKCHLLKDIYERKKELLNIQKINLESLEKLINHQTSFQELDRQIDYQNIARAIQEQVPGLYGKLFIQHFLPYLQGTIQNEKQAKAYQTMIQFWDHAKLKLPIGIRLIYWLNRNADETKMMLAFQKTEKMKLELLNDNEAYEKSKKIMEDYYLKSQSLIFKLFQHTQRKLKIQLQNIGYNDIFIPAMCILSPEYNEYMTRWKELNAKVMQELGLYYDQKMRIRKKE